MESRPPKVIIYSKDERSTEPHAVKAYEEIPERFPNAEVVHRDPNMYWPRKHEGADAVYVASDRTVIIQAHEGRGQLVLTPDEEWDGEPWSRLPEQENPAESEAAAEAKESDRKSVV